MAVVKERYLVPFWLLARMGLTEAKKIGLDWIVLDLNYSRKRRTKGVTKNGKVK